MIVGRGEILELVDPSTGQAVGTLATATAAEVDTAVRAASAAQESWGTIAPVERGRALAQVATLVQEAADELTECVVFDAGLPRSLARRDVETAARYFEFYAGLADKLYGDSIPLGAGFLDYTVRDPWGVCAIVLPFNFPTQLTARDLAPALAMGNTVVLKPPEQAPLPALALVELCWRAGLPTGVVNAVVGTGAVAGEALVRHPLVDHVTFTGSQATGRLVMAACAEGLKASTIELGGKSPHIVFADADIDAAVAAVVATTFRSAGQACSAGTRVLVHRDVRARLVESLAAATRELRVGPAPDDPDVGPLMTSRQVDAVMRAIDASRADGASVVTGGRRPERDGFFVEPTILADVDSASAAARDEIFGPVVTVLEFSSDDEAVALANDSDFGLVAGVWTRDVSRAHRIAAAVKAGQVFINNYGVGGGVELPFGGYKRSGMGRVKGVAAAHEYSQLKNVCVALG